MANNGERQKVRVSREEFAQALLYFLQLSVSKKHTKELGRQFHFKVKKDEDFLHLRHELLLLNIWFIVDACKLIIKDIEKRNACLNRLLGLLFAADTGGRFEGVPAWLETVHFRCRVYAEAMGTEYMKSGLLGKNSLWQVSKVVGESLFGEPVEDVSVLMTIGSYVASGLTAVAQMVHQYDIE
jgi:hypothetical protein